MANFKVPRWYQELSIPQMQQVFALREVIRRDYQEHAAERTQKILHGIGITSTFVKVSSRKIKHLHKSTQLDPALFLCEVYRYISGKYFEDEGYKHVYDCNERLVLSAISFLKLPETINELHKRLPLRINIKFPSKPLHSKVSVRKYAKSPYLEPLFEPIDWRQYRKKLQKWKNKSDAIVKPQIILPPAYLLEKPEDFLDNDLAKLHVKKRLKKNCLGKAVLHSKKNSVSNVLASTTDKKLMDVKKKLEENQELKKSLSINERLQQDEELENIKQELFYEKKDQQKEMDDFVQGINIPKKTIENESTEKKLIIDSNKFKSFSNKKFLYGRENLSLKWQEWFCDIDDDYRNLEKIANCMLKNVREVIRNIYNPDFCDDCCACKYVRKALIKKHTSKAPYLLLDSVVMDENNKTNMIGSLVLNSPPESLPDSWTNLPQVIPSQKKMIKKKIISGITVDEKGKCHLLISGVVKETLNIPGKIKYLDPFIKNVSPCSCCEHELEYNGKDENEDGVQYSEDGVCIAEKYRSNESCICDKCSDNICANKVFRDFERACKDRENREKQISKPIDHQTCTQRFFIEEKNVEKLEVQVSEEAHPLIKLMDEIDQEKMLGRSKVLKKSSIKEYRDKIRFGISAVVENLDNNNNNNNNARIKSECPMEKYVLSEVAMQTPKTITPEPSESDLSDISISLNRLHHHWSVTKFIPKLKPIQTKPIVRPRFRFDVNKWKEIIDQPYRKDIEELFEKVRELNLSNQLLNDHEKKDSARNEKTAFVKNSQVKKKYQTRRIRKIKKKDVVEPNNEIKTEANHEEAHQLKISEKESRQELIDDFSKKSLTNLMKIALQEMAKEGYLLAKLPVCYNIPQLRMWIMYREGFTLTEKQKHDLLEKNEKIWSLIELESQYKIVAPIITMKERKHKSINYNYIKTLQAEVELKKKLFYSKVRKLRVLKSHKIWNQMEFETFPNLTFKQAYFTYQPSKEADGYFKKPYGFNPSL